MESESVLLFPAGLADGVTTGGRVLAVTGVGTDLAAAREAAYRGMADVRFDGMQVRRDIGWRAPGAELRSYAAAGVDIDEGNRASIRVAEKVGYREFARSVYKSAPVVMFERTSVTS